MPARAIVLSGFNKVSLTRIYTQHLAEVFTPVLKVTS
jgi:hypothetical protein